ncbi:uncharacterized protein LY79DRAFT_505712 [Colletotrichum navitas]|uniref:S-adenosylmethionine-dependent methyltransferase-like protein n=1 Tax=Colletotrichum navitas TaxID=681940 RepID=A0AAD8Q9Q4_9PEZI|nr:uncharacterized protein LY79DRAFT_505712 [Colletotrichum navitas]KAK1598575.1 hypothetical protein LY79DRAFT_505712 [Colletotrichum navitas]
MPTFGRIGRHHNRSQQALVDQGGEVAGPAASHSTATPAPPSGSAASGPGAPSSSSSSSSSHPYPYSSSLAPASGPPGPAPAPVSSAITTNAAAAGANSQITPHSVFSTAFGSSESFDTHQTQLTHQHQHQHQQPQLQHLQQQQPNLPQQGQQGSPALPHVYPPSSTSAAATASRNSLLLQHQNPPIADLRQRSQQDFADPQPQRYQPAVAPYPNNNNNNHQFTTAASSSVDNLRASGNNTSPAPLRSPAPSPVPPPAPEKRSARRLLKNILGGSGRDHHNTPPSQTTPPNSYDNTAGLARRPSKRVSNPPPAKTALSQRASQLSLDRQSVDWPLSGPHQQPPQLQGVGEIEDHRLAQDPNIDPRLQSPEPNRNSVRYVPADFEDTSYDDSVHGDRQKQQQLGHQPAYDPSQQQQQQQQQYQQISQQQSAQYQAGPPAIYTSHLGAGSHQNPETVSQLSHESPVTDSDARSAIVQSTQSSPAVRYAVHTTDSPQPPTLPPSQQGTPQPHQQNMAPPSGGPPPIRRSQETEKALRSQVDAPSGPPPSYRQNPSMPPAAGGAAAAFRPGVPQEAGEQGRNSPQPSNPDRDGADPDKFKELLTKYKNVKRLYFDGKTQIENLNSQIEQLQNALANQRMSQSRTALDDSEYITRFNRLNGAINNLSFNIRKDWRTIPQWLDMFVSIDALKTGKQEMTAVGRAVITRWIVEEIFNKCFHPGLNFDLSRQLKEIELNIRRFSYTMTSQEEFDALTTKVVSWRMATLEGLQRVLNSPESADNRADFTRMCTSNLTATLFQYMTDPPPAGVDGSASMIVELAVGIAANLPLESRDVAINYPLPGDPVQPNIMDVEKTPLPPLDAPKAEGEAEGDEGDKDKNNKPQRAEKSKSGMFTTILGGGTHAGRKGSTASSIVLASTDAAPPSALPPKDSNVVRLAGFPAVEVRGRQVLVKATVWTI